jgi:hypothetical protein
MSSARRENPLTMEVSADWRILLFSVAVTVAVGILFGMAPALGSTRSVALNERSEIGETRRFSFGKLLISFQVALTIVLVVGCGLFPGGSPIQDQPWFPERLFRQRQSGFVYSASGTSGRDARCVLGHSESTRASRGRLDQ